MIKGIQAKKIKKVKGDPGQAIQAMSPLDSANHKNLYRCKNELKQRGVVANV
jgi:hypothetical protein